MQKPAAYFTRHQLFQLAPLFAVFFCCIVLSACSGEKQGPQYPGEYSGDGLEIKLEQDKASDQFKGYIKLNGQEMPFVAVAKESSLVGEFTLGSNSFAFSAELSGDELVLSSADKKYKMKRKDKNPLAVGPQPEAVKIDSPKKPNPLSALNQPLDNDKQKQKKDEQEAIFNPKKPNKPVENVLPTSTNQVVALDSKFTASNGSTIGHPSSWQVVENGGYLVLTPSDQKKRGQEPAEFYVGASTAAGNIRSIRDQTVAQNAINFIREAVPNMQAVGQPEYKQLGNYEAAIFKYEGSNPKNEKLDGRIWVVLQSNTLACFAGFGYAGNVAGRQPVILQMLNSTTKAKVNIDPNLVGSWRYTKTYTSGTFTSVSELYLTLRADGTAHRDSQLAAGDANSSGSVGRDGGNNGTWSVNGKKLIINLNGPEHYSFYHDGQGTLMLTDGDGNRKIWKKYR